jgi:septal ring factor EnvC (AmiA/AmiB activator)
MLQNFKITSCAFILVLFGLTLMTVSPVLAADGDGFTVCDNKAEAAEKLQCFRDLARSLRAAVEDMTTAASSQEAAVDDAEGTKEALKLQIEEINGWLEEKDARIEEKDARIADLQEQFSTASSELQDKDGTIANLQSQLSTASSELQDKDETIADLQSQLTDVKINSIKGMSLEGLRDLISELVAAEEEMVAAEIKAKTREYCTDRTREEGTCIGGRTPGGFCSPRPFHPGCKDMKAMDPEWRLDRAFRGCEKDQSGEGGFTGCKDPD